MGCSVSKDTVSRGMQTKLADFLDGHGILKDCHETCFKDEFLLDGRVPEGRILYLHFRMVLNVASV